MPGKVLLLSATVQRPNTGHHSTAPPRLAAMPGNNAVKLTQKRTETGRTNICTQLLWIRLRGRRGGNVVLSLALVCISPAVRIKPQATSLCLHHRPLRACLPTRSLVSRAQAGLPRSPHSARDAGVSACGTSSVSAALLMSLIRLVVWGAGTIFAVTSSCSSSLTP